MPDNYPQTGFHVKVFPTLQQGKVHASCVSMINVWVISIRLGLDQIHLDARKPTHAHTHRLDIYGKAWYLTLAFRNWGEMCTVCGDISLMQPPFNPHYVSHFMCTSACSSIAFLATMKQHLSKSH